MDNWEVFVGNGTFFYLHVIIDDGLNWRAFKALGELEVWILYELELLNNKILETSNYKTRISIFSKIWSRKHKKAKYKLFRSFWSFWEFSYDFLSSFILDYWSFWSFWRFLELFGAYWSFLKLFRASWSFLKLSEFLCFPELFGTLWTLCNFLSFLELFRAFWSF